MHRRLQAKGVKIYADTLAGCSEPPTAGFALIGFDKV
jgi:hypothetical protein